MTPDGAAPTRSAGTAGAIAIDLGALAWNWTALAKLVAPAECGAVVKADAYGLGAERVVPALSAAGCRSFFVATPDEALEIRRIAPDAQRVFVLDGLVPGSEAMIEAADAVPCLASLDEVRSWSAHAKACGQQLAAAIHIDSGLNRLGLAVADVEALSREGDTLAALSIELVMSHLACADQPAHAKNEAQRTTFDRLRALLPPAPASLAASDGLMLGPAFHYDLVRPGYGLYGGQAFRGGASPVKPVLEVTAPVIQVRDVAAGESVGYAAVWHALKPSRVAVIAAGYADGYGRGASASDDAPGGHVVIHGQIAPIAGRVSMDLITVDVTGIDPPVERGDIATLIGPGLPLEVAGRVAGTIGYEVLTRLSRRFQRRYVQGSEPA